jgi:pilus assembly protein CpaB
LALASGLIAAILAFNFLRSPSAPDQFQRTATATVPVVVAARDLNVGATLTSEDVRIVEWPGEALPSGYASGVEEVVGRGVMVPIRTNEPLLPEKLAGEDLGRGLTMLIPEGMRAMSVPVNDVVAVAGWVRPGTRVDVLVTLTVPNQTEPVTQVVLQNVEVLGNDRSIQRDSEGEAQAIAVMTFLVTPEQAERLAMAENEGRLHLVLRGQIDLDSIETPGVRPSELLPRRPGPVVRTSTGAVVPAPPSRVTVEVFRGNARTESTVERGGGGG